MWWELYMNFGMTTSNFQRALQNLTHQYNHKHCLFAMQRERLETRQWSTLVDWGCYTRLYQVALFPEETWQPLKTPNLGSGSNAQATRVGARQWRHNLWKGKVKRIQRRVSVLLFRYLQKMYWFFRRCLEWRNTLAEIYSTFLLTWTKTCYLQGENCIFWELQLQ